MQVPITREKDIYQKLTKHIQYVMTGGKKGEISNVNTEFVACQGFNVTSICNVNTVPANGMAVVQKNSPNPNLPILIFQWTSDVSTETYGSGNPGLAADEVWAQYFSAANIGPIPYIPWDDAVTGWFPSMGVSNVRYSVSYDIARSFKAGSVVCSDSSIRTTMIFPGSTSFQGSMTDTQTVDMPDPDQWNQAATAGSRVGNTASYENVTINEDLHVIQIGSPLTANFEGQAVQRPGVPTVHEEVLTITAAMLTACDTDPVVLTNYIRAGMNAYSDNVAATVNFSCTSSAAFTTSNIYFQLIATWFAVDETNGFACYESVMGSCSVTISPNTIDYAFNISGYAPCPTQPISSGDPVYPWVFGGLRLQASGQDGTGAAIAVGSALPTGVSATVVLTYNQADPSFNYVNICNIQTSSSVPFQITRNLTYLVVPNSASMPLLGGNITKPRSLIFSNYVIDALCTLYGSSLGAVYRESYFQELRSYFTSDANVMKFIEQADQVDGNMSIQHLLDVEESPGEPSLVHSSARGHKWEHYMRRAGKLANQIARTGVKVGKVAATLAPLMADGRPELYSDGRPELYADYRPDYRSIINSARPGFARYANASERDDGDNEFVHAAPREPTDSPVYRRKNVRSHIKCNSYERLERAVKKLKFQFNFVTPILIEQDGVYFIPVHAADRGGGGPKCLAYSGCHPMRPNIVPSHTGRGPLTHKFRTLAMNNPGILRKIDRLRAGDKSVKLSDAEKQLIRAGLLIQKIHASGRDSPVMIDHEYGTDSLAIGDVKVEAPEPDLIVHTVSNDWVTQGTPQKIVAMAAQLMRGALPYGYGQGNGANFPVFLGDNDEEGSFAIAQLKVSNEAKDASGLGYTAIRIGPCTVFVSNHLSKDERTISSLVNFFSMVNRPNLTVYVTFFVDASHSASAAGMIKGNSYGLALAMAYCGVPVGPIYTGSVNPDGTIGEVGKQVYKVFKYPEIPIMAPSSYFMNDLVDADEEVRLSILARTDKNGVDRRLFRKPISSPAYFVKSVRDALQMIVGGCFCNISTNEPFTSLAEPVDPIARAQESLMHTFGGSDGIDSLVTAMRKMAHGDSADWDSIVASTNSLNNGTLTQYFDNMKTELTRNRIKARNYTVSSEKTLQQQAEKASKTMGRLTLAEEILAGQKTFKSLRLANGVVIKGVSDCEFKPPCSNPQNFNQSDVPAYCAEMTSCNKAFKTLVELGGACQTALGVLGPIKYEPVSILAAPNTYLHMPRFLQGEKYDKVVTAKKKKKAGRTIAIGPVAGVGSVPDTTDYLAMINNT